MYVISFKDTEQPPFFYFDQLYYGRCKRSYHFRSRSLPLGSGPPASSLVWYYYLHQKDRSEDVLFFFCIVGFDNDLAAFYCCFYCCCCCCCCHHRRSNSRSFVLAKDVVCLTQCFDDAVDGLLFSERLEKKKKRLIKHEIENNF